MGQINVPAAQDITKGKTSITIGILDTGVDATHPGANFTKMSWNLFKIRSVLKSQIGCESQRAHLL